MSTTVEKRIIPIATPSMGEEEWIAVKEPIEKGWLTQGPKVKEFETLFAQMHNVKHALAVSNCTTALHLALLACGVGEGDEVIVPSFTWVATANAVLYCNATPVLVDIDIKTFNIDINEIEKKVTSKTKAIIPVHLFGLCADIDNIREKFPRLKIIEDGACASGANLHEKPAGSMGDVGCFSFHPRKSVTCGEGGMLTTNDDNIAAYLDMLRNHGASISEEQRHHGPKPYLLAAYDIIGYNYRMTDLQGAVGFVQLKKLNSFIEERNQWAQYYSEQLVNVKWLHTPQVPEGFRHGWQSYVTYVDEAKAPMKRNEIMEILQQRGISTRPGTHAIHMLGAYVKKFGYKPQDFPSAFAADQYSMAIPLHNKMVKEDFDYIIQALKSL
ncbi:MAG TPA: DegT/DnrJ/EryC1/StrS family aminotransferase [Chitinophagaceae bacterium]|nr:DegT/DnrJ/EryC1/StrS family aminotransferase [Chitinophagaceae bacterium]